MPEAEEMEITIQANGLAKIERTLLESTMISWEALIDPEWESE